jgi:hypothetical protein
MKYSESDDVNTERRFKAACRAEVARLNRIQKQKEKQQ